MNYWARETKLPYPLNTLGMGAIIGDIVGSRYRFNHVRADDFVLIPKKAEFTETTLMTLAIADGILRHGKNLHATKDEQLIKIRIGESISTFCRRYSRKYSKKFKRWLVNRFPRYEQGVCTAACISPIAWLSNNLDDVLRNTQIVAEALHTHPDDIKGAKAVASSIFLTRKGMDKAELKEYIHQTFGFGVDKPSTLMRSKRKQSQTYDDYVSNGIICYLEGYCYEDTIRKAVSLGREANKLAAIAGSIAEARYPILETNYYCGRIDSDPIWKLFDNHIHTVLYKYQKEILSIHQMNEDDAYNMIIKERIHGLLEYIPFFTKEYKEEEKRRYFSHDNKMFNVFLEAIFFYWITNEDHDSKLNIALKYDLFGRNLHQLFDKISVSDIQMLFTMLFLMSRSAHFSNRYDDRSIFTDAADCGLLGEILKALKDRIENGDIPKPPSISVYENSDIYDSIRKSYGTNKLKHRLIYT